MRLWAASVMTSVRLRAARVMMSVRLRAARALTRVQLRVARLRYLPQASRGPPLLTALIQAGGDWRDLVVEDLAAVEAVHPYKVSSLGSPRVVPWKWEASWKEYPTHDVCVL